MCPSTFAFVYVLLERYIEGRILMAATDTSSSLEGLPPYGDLFRVWGGFE